MGLSSLPGLLSLGRPVAYYEDQQTSGTHGGTCTSGSWQTRTINTEVYDGIGCSVSSNQITIPAGTYWIRWSAPTLADGHQTRLRNATDNTTIGTGSTERASSAYGACTRSHGEAVVTFAASKAVELQHRVTTTISSTGYGYAASFGTEVYSQILIVRLS